MRTEQNRTEQKRTEQQLQYRTEWNKIRIRIRIIVRRYSISHQFVPVLFAPQIRVRSCNKTLFNHDMLQKAKRIQKFALLTKQCIGRQTA